MRQDEIDDDDDDACILSFCYLDVIGGKYFDPNWPIFDFDSNLS